MQRSLSYYILILVLKLKGIKKSFSKDPIDFKKIRKQDLHEPKSTFFKNHANSFSVLDTLITEVKVSQVESKLILFIHGGAYVSGPGKHHWDGIKKISTQTNSTVWMCDYPKAPEKCIQEISRNIDQVYKKALEKFEPGEISIIGDSVGASLIIALIQRTIQSEGILPKQLILISPVMDATMSNTDIEEIESKDPMLSKTGVLSAKRMCAKNIDLSNPIISPINGTFEGFPNTVFFLGSNDITYPDQKLTIEKMKSAKVEIEIFEGKEMPHIWPLLPVMKEAKLAFTEILNRL